MSDPFLAAWYLPHYHAGDVRLAALHGADWTQWRLVDDAVPRFDGHQQPRRPLWGPGDESDPAVMARKIDVAADHGLGAFVFHHYQYDGAPFLDGALERGFKRAANRERLRYALCWANHDWYELHPLRVGDPPQRRFSGLVTPAGFDALIEHWCAEHLAHPAYWRVAGQPYLAIYDLPQLVASFGDLQVLHEALARLRARCHETCGAAPHLAALVWSDTIPLPGGGEEDLGSFLRYGGFASATSHHWVHHVPFNDWPACDYAAAWRSYLAWASELRERLPIPYHPNLSVGWDPSPLCAADGAWYPAGYPATPLYWNAQPAVFHQVCAEMAFALDSLPAEQRICLIHAWNAWTEGSHLEPDAAEGMARLEILREVFG